MSTRLSPTLTDLFRTTPIRTSLLTLTPVGLALGQLASSLLTDLSPVVALGFAAVMIGFAVVATGHHAAEVRLARLERSTNQPGAVHPRTASDERP